MTKNDLIQIIKNTKNHFPNNIVLAYNALKGKVEEDLNVDLVNQINNVPNPTYFALKGWNDIDVAVFSGINIPISLIEMKTHNSIDFPGWLIYSGTKYPMIKDIVELSEHAQTNTDCYFIFYNNVLNCTALPNNSLVNIGYWNLVKRFFHLSYKDKVLRVFKNWAYLLEQLGLPQNLTTAVEINAGQNQGIDVSIIAFVYGPFNYNLTSILKRRRDDLPHNHIFNDPKFWDKTESDKILLEGIKFEGIDFYYENDALNNLADGIQCIKI